jgi:hypothetical protein
MSGSKQNEILKGVRVNGTYNYQIRRQSTKLKFKQHILGVIQHYSSRNVGTMHIINIPETQQ